MRSEKYLAGVEGTRERHEGRIRPECVVHKFEKVITKAITMCNYYMQLKAERQRKEFSCGGWIQEKGRTFLLLA